jgi:hypothetical protein
MIKFEMFARIKSYHQQKGLKPAQIARELGLDPRTVAKWIQQNHFRPRAPVQRASKLDPYKAAIVRMLETHPLYVTHVLPLCGIINVDVVDRTHPW